MKKTLCLLGFLGFALMMIGNPVWADETNEETISPLDQNLLRGRLDSLEREINQLEDKIRFLDERTKNLDRRVDDLRQRR